MNDYQHHDHVHGCSQQHHDPVQGLQVERHELRRPWPLHLRDEMRGPLNMIHDNQKFAMDTNKYFGCAVSEL